MVFGIGKEERERELERGDVREGAWSIGLLAEQIFRNHIKMRNTGRNGSVC
jgi:hypothetical protein